ncbi:MAG TPA: patatin-like phospholipase family protein [Gemmatimonadales bacterium]|nr:patatin-like phospholipase family protein [Gemmatimonadales bacterium]
MPTASNPYSDLALVLSGGGARAAYQAGALRAVAELVPDLNFPIITGVSAGAINTVYLAAHEGSLTEAVHGLVDQWARLRSPDVYRVHPTVLVRDAVRMVLDAITGRRSGRPALRGLLDMSPLRGFLASCIDINGIERNLALGRLRAAALSATSYTNGCTVTFVDGARDLSMWSRAQRYATREPLTFEHVLASAAIPIVFPAVRLGDGYYGDGSVRQAAPLAPSIHLGARRLLAIGMRAERPTGLAVTDIEYPSSAEVLGLLMHSIFLDSLDTDAERLERINRTLALFPPDAASKPDMRRVDLLVLRPSRNLGAMAGDYRADLPPVLNTVVRALGGRRRRAADFLSYLMFTPPFTHDLMELGYLDTLRHRETIEAFLHGAPTPSVE